MNANTQIIPPMNSAQCRAGNRAIGLAALAWVSVTLQAQTTTIPETLALPSSAADSTKPGFIFRVSQVAADTNPNQLASAEKQLAGFYGENLADPQAVGVALAAATVANPSTAPLRFEIATVIHLNRTGGENRGGFHPNEQMPGVPGSTASTANIAGEVLTYLDLPVGTLSMGVIGSTFFRVQIGGVTLGDQFGATVGQIEDDQRRGGHGFNIVVTKAGLYPARVLFENAGDNRTYVQWYTGGPGAKVLVNDLANSGVKAYRALTTSSPLAYSRSLIPNNGQQNVLPNPHFHAELVDGSAAIDKTKVSALLDDVPVTPSVTVGKVDNITSVDFDGATPLAPGVHSAAVVYTENGSKVTRSWRFTVGNYVTLDPAWRVAVDSSKPGFNWNIFANSDAANKNNTVIRAETDLSLFAADAAGVSLPNLADPSAVGAAIAAAVAPVPANAPVHFEIAGTIELDATANMPGSPSTDSSTDGQAAEILTYLTLPAGVTTMVLSHDDEFSTSSGPNPKDAFGRVELGSSASPLSTFAFVVPQAGTYPFRTVWENGGGGSVIRWYSRKPDGTKVLVNDVAQGGISAFRATTTPSAAYVKGANPPAVPRQLEFTSSGVSVIVVDGANPVVDASVIFQLDGKPVTTPAVRQGKYLTVSTGVVPGFQAGGEAHRGVLTFKDSAGVSRTQQWAIYNLQNLNLPASPVAGENFDSLPESTSEANTVPPGWVATDYTLHETAGWNLANQNSDAYWGWVTISTDTVNGIEKEVLQNDPTQLINGVPIGDNWMKGNLLFAASDGRAGDGNPQAQFAVTKPFNLSTANNPVLTFYSGQRITDNRSEADAVEYSVDGGTSWLPGAYYHFRTITLSPDGSFDALTMFNDPNNGHVPTWTVPGVPGVSGGTFGAGILAPITSALSPYIAERSNNKSSVRVEAIRLPAASKKSDVRVRFSHLGSCGWEWGIDNIAFYDIAPTTLPATPKIDSIVGPGGPITIKWTTGTLESTPSLTNPVWTSTGNTSGIFTEAAGIGNKFYRVKL